MLEENNNRPSASIPTGETGRKASLRQKLGAQAVALDSDDSNHSCPDRLA